MKKRYLTILIGIATLILFNGKILAQLAHDNVKPESLSYFETNANSPRLDQTDSLPGQDNNNNGVRDDIETYIDYLDEPDVNKLALMTYARAHSTIMSTNLYDTAQVRESIKELLYATACLNHTFKAPHYILELEASVRNTPERREHAAKAHATYSGSFFFSPDKSECEAA